MRTFAPQSAEKDSSSPKHRAVLSQSLPAPVAFPPTSHSNGVLLQRKSNCACGGGCPSCAEEATAGTIQAKLKVSDPGDQYESEADRVAEQVMRMPASSSVGIKNAKSGGACPKCQSEIGIQPKLKVGAPNDKYENDVYEQEADQVADQIMRMPDLSAQADLGQSDSGINIRRIASGDSRAAIAEVDIQLNQSGGQPLSPSTRAFMEPRFGIDFSHVRLHTDEQSHQTASQIQARAFTYGQHIWLGRGESEQNKSLMAHELTHVMQQGTASSADQVSSNAVTKSMAEPRLQCARLPCTTRKTIDVYGVNLPGSTRTISDDLANANSVLCQCGIDINVAGGQSLSTNLMDSDPPAGVLNEFTTVGTPTAEETALLGHQPGGSAIHAYYVPALSRRSRGESFPKSVFPTVSNNAVVMADSAAADTFAHELGHVLLDDEGHHGTADNLMAEGAIRNVGVDELEGPQCGRMP